MSDNKQNRTSIEEILPKLIKISESGVLPSDIIGVGMYMNSLKKKIGAVTDRNWVKRVDAMFAHHPNFDIIGLITTLLVIRRLSSQSKDPIEGLLFSIFDDDVQLVRIAVDDAIGAIRQLMAGVMSSNVNGVSSDTESSGGQFTFDWL